MRTIAFLLGFVLAGCLLPEDGPANDVDDPQQRAAQAVAQLDAMHDEALVLAPLHEELAALGALDPALAAADTTLDVDATLARFDRYADALFSIAEHAQELQALAAREADVGGVGVTSLALTEEQSCPGWLERVWAQWRGYSSNVAGGPVPVDNLLGVAEKADAARAQLRTKLEQKRAACERVRNVSERHLCIARVDAEMRPLLAAAASEVAGAGGFSVIKALGSAAVGGGLGAGLGVLIGVGSGGTVVLAAVGATLFENAVDYFLVPADAPVDATTAKPVALLRVPAGAAGTASFDLPVGRYQVIGRVRASGAVAVSELSVEPGRTAELPRPACDTVTPTVEPATTTSVSATPAATPTRSCGGAPWNGDRCYFVWSAQRYKCDLVDATTYRYEWRPHAVPYYRGFAVCQPDHLTDFISCDPYTGHYEFDFQAPTMEEHLRMRLADAATLDCLLPSDLSNVTCNAPWLLQRMCGAETIDPGFALGTQDASLFTAFVDSHKNGSTEGPVR